MIPVHEASNSRARNLDDRGRHTRAVIVKRRLRTAGVCLMQIEGKIQTADYIQAVQEDGAIKKVPESV